MILHERTQIDAYRAAGQWGDTTVDDLLRQAVARDPGRLAIADAPNRADFAHGMPARLTFWEVDRAVDRLVSEFAAVGVTNESIVVVQLPNVVELVLTCLACARVGAVVSPLPVQFGRHEIGQVIEVLQRVDAVVTASHFKRVSLAATWNEVLDEQGGEATSLLLFDSSGGLVPRAVRIAETIRQSPNDKSTGRRPRIDADEIFTICWTSGTIAAPKGVPRSHNNWVLYSRMVAEACDLHDGERILSPFPIVNLSGIGISLLVWLHQAGTLHLHHPFSADVFLEQITRDRITFAVAAPAVLTMILQDPSLVARYDLGSLRAVMSGAAGLSGWMIGEYQRRFGIEIINGFGSNEGTTLTSSARDVPDATQRAELFPRIGGREVPPRLAYHRWVQTKLVDPLTQLEIEQPGVPGELLIRSGAVFPGYYQRPDLTAAAFDGEGYFRTGDLFEIQTDGDGAPVFYRFVGRHKSLIVRGGMKIAPEELASLIGGHPAVAEADAAGFHDRVLGERVCACVALRPGATLTLPELVAYLREKGIATYKLPEKLLVLERLPRNPIGKVARQALQRLVDTETAAG